MSLMMYGLMRGAGAAAPAGGGGSSTDLLTLNVALNGTAGYKYWDYDAQYLGAFRVPFANYGGIAGDNLNYCSDPIIGMGSTTGHIMIAGRNRGDTVTTIAELAIPALSTSGTLSSLDIATCSQNFIEVLTSAPTDGETWSGRMIAGIANVDGKVVVTAYGYYTGANRPVMVIDDVSPLSSASFRGYFDMTNDQRAGGWVTPIPASYQASFGGTHLFGFSMSQTRAILSKYSIGPSAYVYDFSAGNSITGASPVANGSTLSTTVALDYPLANGLTPEANLGNSGTHWTYCSGGQIGFIVPGTRTYMVIGFSAGHSSGSAYYDPAPYDAGFKGYAPNSASDIYNYYWLFDVDDMVDVLNSVINSYDPDPYEHGQLSLRHDGGSGWTTLHHVGGATFDATNNKLYISLQYADDSQASESDLPLILCYDLSGVAA